LKRLRETALAEWSQQVLRELETGDPEGFPRRLSDQVWLNSLGGDAGFRHYYRVNTQPSLLAVDAPPATENSAAFVAIGQQLRENGIHTPEVIAFEPSEGFLLIEDLGYTSYHSALLEQGPDLLYGEAMMSLLRMQQITPDDRWDLPHYDHKRLNDEMALFPEWFVQQNLQYSLSNDENVMLEKVFQSLSASALAQPSVFVHRDFHSRNLMAMEGCAPGVIDFQDAVWGPITYDLVSLYRDCYLRWPRDQVERWACAYGEMLVDAKLMPEIHHDEFLKWFDWMGLQRHIKVLGIFSRLSLRDGKSAYLDDIPLVIRYVLEVSDHYSEFHDFAVWFRAQLLPLIEHQPWYQPIESAGERP